MTLEEVQAQVGRALELLHKAVGEGDYSERLNGIIAGLIPPEKEASGNGETAVKESGDPAAPSEPEPDANAESGEPAADAEPEPAS